jgi:hypothetical protein
VGAFAKAERSRTLTCLLGSSPNSQLLYSIMFRHFRPDCSRKMTVTARSHPTLWSGRFYEARGVGEGPRDGGPGASSSNGVSRRSSRLASQSADSCSDVSPHQHRRRKRSEEFARVRAFPSNRRQLFTRARVPPDACRRDRGNSGARRGIAARAVIEVRKMLYGIIKRLDRPETP